MGKETFLEVFNELLGESGLNRKKFAEECGIPYTTVIGWTTLGRLPDYASLIKIADYFDCSLDYITGRRGVYEVSDETSAVAEKRREFLSAYDALDDGSRALVFELVKRLKR